MPFFSQGNFIIVSGYFFQVLLLLLLLVWELGAFSVRVFCWFVFFFLYSEYMFPLVLTEVACYCLLSPCRELKLTGQGTGHPAYAKRRPVVMERLTCVSRSLGPTASGCSESGYGNSILCLPEALEEGNRVFGG